jgi:drug/metabolite transporter (DMT)-like permease
MFSVLVIFGLMNSKTKYYMIDAVPRDQYKNLIIRIIVGTASMFCSYFAIKYFPLVLVSLVTNITPLLVALVSYFLYKVGLARMDIANLILSFLGVAILISGDT